MRVTRGQRWRSIGRAALALLIVGWQITAGTVPAYAATFVVNSTSDAVDASPGDGVCATSGAQCTLRAAIQEANALFGSDTITLPAGTYTLSIPGTGEDASATGDLDITSSLTLNGAGASSTIVDGADLDRIFDLSGTSSITMSGLTFRNGTSGGGGGGVRSGSSVSADLSSVRIEDNTATGDGGGVLVSGGSLTITDSTISGNVASGNGGGVGMSSGSLTLTRVTVSGNTATALDGGGLFVTGAATITNSTFSGNTAGDEGGGIRGALASSIDVLHSTIASNTATAGGGIVGSSATFTNTIVSGNAPDECAGSQTSNGYNLEAFNTCGFGQPTDLVNTNPLLGPLASNGGPTQTHALLAGSAAIDSGPATCPTTDQRGIARPQDGNGDTTSVCDRGAFELEPVPVTVSGTIFDDLVGDNLLDGPIGGAANPGVSGVSVYLYVDDGDNRYDSGDALAPVAPNPATTNASGAYSFSSVVPGTYWVVVNSKTVPSSQDPTAAQTDIWAEQTYGPQGARCTDGPGPPAALSAAGPCYGGAEDGGVEGVSDDTSTAEDAEHFARLAVGAADVTNVDFGFSFNVVTNILDGDDDLGANRTKQGSLRQFIQNASAISGLNAMRFAPVGSTNASGSGGSWWRVSLGSALPSVSGSGTTIDGQAYCAWSNGTSGCSALTQVRDPNSGTAGNSGASVGTGADGRAGTGDEPTLPSYSRPELEINGGDNGIGLLVTGGGTTIRRIALYNTSSHGVRFDGGSGGLIQQSFIGARASGSSPPANQEVAGHGIEVRNGGADIRDNLVSYTRDIGIWVINTSLIQGNDVYVPNMVSSVDDGIAVGGTGQTITVRQNRVEAANAYGIETWGGTGPFTIEDNSVIDTGNGGGSELGGIRLFGQGSTVRHNVIRDTAGAGIVVVENALSQNSQNRITQNAIYRNGGPGIDIDVTNLSGSPNGDGITPNDGTTDPTLPNIETDYPVLTTVQLRGTTLHVEGYVGTAASPLADTFTIEFFEVDVSGDPGTGDSGEIEAGDSLNVRHGEGRWYVGSCSPVVVTTFTCDLVGAPSMTDGDTITATATDSSNNTSEFGPNTTVVEAFGISGTVFEDVNYGGGAGRTYSTAATDAPGFTVERGGVTVELYDAAGSLLDTQVTAADGSYSFFWLVPAPYTVRVVNDSVTSTRAGANGTELGVQTYRVDGFGEPAGTGAARIGGEQPADIDAPANGGAQTLADLQAPAGQHTQSIVTVNVTGNVTGVDFGFNFDTVVNTRDAGQGSLRRFIQNANLLTDQALLSQDGLTAGRETSVFMIPVTDPAWDGTDFTITVASPLPQLTDPGTHIDGTTQTAFTGDSSPAVAEVTTGPEIVIDYGLVVGRGLDLVGDDLLVDGIGITRTGGSSSSGTGIYVNGAADVVIQNVTVWRAGGYGIALRASAANVQILDSVSRQNGQVEPSNDGINVSGLSNGITIARNQLIDNGGFGIDLQNSGSFITIEDNLIKGNGIGGTSQNGGIAARLGPGGSDITIRTNTIVENIGDGVLVHDVWRRVRITQNVIFDNTELSIDLDPGRAASGDGVTLNDPNDADTGGNELQNFPVLTGAASSGGTTSVTGTLDTDTPSGAFTVELFSTSTPDASGHGEAEIYLGSDTVTTNGSGDASFTIVLPVSVPVGDVISATATDPDGNTSELGLNIAANHPPVLGAVGGQSGGEQTLITFGATASDPDVGDSLTFSLEAGPGTVPPGASIGPVSGVFSWTPTEAQGPGVYTFDVVVTDDGSPNLQDRETITVTVSEVNVAPSVAPIADQSVDEQTLLSFAASASDQDVPANGLSWSLVAEPAGASIDAGTGVFSWTPSEAQGPGSYLVTVRVTDDGSPNLFDDESFTVTVNEVNVAPVATSPGNQSNAEGEAVSVFVAASDQDVPANGLTWSAVGLPPGLSIDPGTGEMSGTIDYTASVGSPHSVMVTVTDDGSPSMFDQVSFSWTVADVNRPPVLGAVGGQSGGEQTLITFGATASDPDVGDSLTFSLEDGPGAVPPGASIGPVSGVFSWTPTEAQGPGVYTFDVVVTDDGSPNLQDRETITVTVAEVNVAPTVNPIGPQSVNEGTLFSLGATASDADMPANLLTWSLFAAPAGMTIDPATGSMSWTPTEAQGPGVFLVTVRVTDGGTPNLFDEESFTVAVSEVNQPPVVSPILNQANDEGEAVSLAATATDPDVPAQNLTWSAVGLPAGLAINAGTGVISGIIEYSAAAAAPYTVTVTVSDGGTPLLSGQVTFDWAVADNQTPVANPDVYTLTEGTTLSVVAPGVLGNDVDPENDPLAVALLAAPTFGTLTLNPDGSFTYVHQGNGAADDSFAYRLDDGTGSFDIGVVTLQVDPANVAPQPADDQVSLNEDTPVGIAVTANDIDPDGDSLTVVAVSQPSMGAVSVIGPGTVLYMPPLDFWGATSFTYTVSDGAGGRATATVYVKVLPVNDVPVARGEAYPLPSYRTAYLNVLANDWDPDGDSLLIAVGTLPSIGHVEVSGSQIAYTPKSGWVGTTSFTYFAVDAAGARSEATVTVTIRPDVLMGAQLIADELGVGAVPFESPPSRYDATQLGLVAVEGVTLLVNAFFQTAQALRLPLSFLGVTLLMLLGFGTATRVPVLLFGVRHRYWAVVLLDREQVLPAYSGPGDTKIIYNFDPTAAGIVSTGRPKRVGSTEWLPVDTPNGEGWVDRQHLTEQVDLEAFMSDPRPVELVNKLARRLRRGGDVSSLISRRGLVIALTGAPTRIPPERLAGLLGESRLRHLHTVARALDAEDDFRVAVAEPFLEAYDATSHVTAETPHSRTSLIPTECWNFPYLALGDGRGVQPWLVFFEYRRGTAWIAGLGIDE